MNLLIIGGARSGKSSMAEKIARHQEERSGGGVIYLATARAGDDEMEARIAAHRERRPDNWKTLEEELYPGRRLQEHIEWENNAEPGIVLLDCITLLVSNHIVKVREEGDKEQNNPAEEQLYRRIIEEMERIVQLAGANSFDLILVSNEVGLGVVPPSEMGRMFRDISGRINRKLEELCDKTYFMIAGKAVDIEKIASAPLEEDWPV